MRTKAMIIAWGVTLGGLFAGITSLLVRDLVAKRQRQGLPMVPQWLWKTGATLVFTLLLAGLMLPTLVIRCCAAKKGASQSNLTTIGQGMYLYALFPKNMNRFPLGGTSPTESLWLLYPDDMADHRAFWNPQGREPRPERPPRICSNGSRPRVPKAYLDATDYIYLEGYGATDATVIVVYERESHDAGRNVLLGSGVVLWMDEAAFQDALSLQIKDALANRRARHSDGKPSDLSMCTQRQ